MNKGALAILDCLGFRGIWKETTPEMVISKMTAIHQWASSDEFRQTSDFLREHGDRLNVQATLLSDTIVASVNQIPSETEPEMPAFILLQKLVEFVEAINAKFVGEDPRILLRGCITYGEHIITDRFIIGPAVDRAASYEKLANGAFIWLDPAAGRLYDEYLTFMRAVSFPKLTEDGINRLLRDDSLELSYKLIKIAISQVGFRDHPKFAVPIKGGESLVSYVVQPFRGLNKVKQGELYKTFEEILSRDDRIDVVIKRNNTLAFLDYVIKCDDELDEEMTQHLIEKEMYGLVDSSDRDWRSKARDILKNA
ncbi:MAG: hypothetical protein PSX80_00925 [bacterium]|nr:hypothetical protein [bacterium]